MTYGTLIGVPTLYPRDTCISRSSYTAPKMRCQAAEIRRRNFRTVALSQSYDTVAMITKIMKRLHVNVAQNPPP